MTSPARWSKLTERFLAHDLGDARFGHEGHVQVAFDLLRSHDFIDAAAIYAKGIRAIAARAGASKKFNLTITYAFMSLIAERMDRSPGLDFCAFVERNPDLMSKGLLEQWYSRDRLTSEAARAIFLLPDAPPAPDRA